MMTEIELQRAFWNRNVEEFDSIYAGDKRWTRAALNRVFRKDMHERFRFTMENSAPVAAKRILDVGCGTGHYVLAFARQGAHIVHGIDVSDAMIDVCMKRAAKYGFSSTCMFTLGNPLDMELDRKYDVAIGIGLFDYIKDPLPLIEWMRGRTAGKVILSFPRRYTWRAPVRKLRLRAKGCPVYFYSKQDVVSLHKRAGLEILKLEKIGKLYCTVAFSA